MAYKAQRFKLQVIKETKSIIIITSKVFIKSIIITTSIILTKSIILHTHVCNIEHSGGWAQNKSVYHLFSNTNPLTFAFSQAEH
jgi:hypothetical protein